MSEMNLNQEEVKEEVVEPEIIVEGSHEPETQEDPAELKRLLAEKIAEVEAHNSKALRLQADYENLRRRSRQEREDLLKYGSEQLILALLPVLDNFERALNSSGDGGEKFVSGVQMIHRQFIEVLTSEGVTPVAAVGEQFDPNLHEAVMQVEDTGSPENTVVEELRQGYYLKGKIIRPAMVKVARS